MKSIICVMLFLFSSHATAADGVFDPVFSPTDARPYYYGKFDRQTKEKYPDADPITSATLHSEKLVVLNFIDEKNPRFSQMQSMVLERTLSALAPDSEAKPLLLMDIVVRDKQGSDLYWPHYSAYYDDNKLGPNNSKRTDAMLPYGVAIGGPFDEDGRSLMFDFAILNGVLTDKDLNTNANAITVSIVRAVNTYNQYRQKAAPE